MHGGTKGHGLWASVCTSTFFLKIVEALKSHAGITHNCWENQMGKKLTLYVATYRDIPPSFELKSCPKVKIFWRGISLA